MRHRLFFALLMACCLSTMLLSVAHADEYRLGPGDTLVVIVKDHPTFGGTVTVTMDGMIQLPVVNQVAVSGLSLPEAIERLTTAYKRRLVNPEIYVSLTTPQLARAYIVGAVAKPGIYPLNKNLSTVLDLLMVAGGLSHPLEQCTAILTRKVGGEKVTVRLGAVLAGDKNANRALGDGDLLTIEAQPSIHVYVAGDVETPGLYELPVGATVSQALASAKGIKGPVADFQGTILREKTLIPIDLLQLYQLKVEADVTLHQADVIRIETAKLKVEVAGDVRTPAVYSISRGMGLAEVLTLAGGAHRTANLAAVTVTHRDGTQEIANLSAARAAAKPLVLAEGDKIFVPSSLVAVAIAGEVKSPGTFQFSPQVTLQDAITVAGGTTAAAALSAVKLHRADGAVDVFDLSAGTVHPINWQAGDRIIVSPMTSRILVLGNVVSPGYQPFDAAHPYTASEAVMLAGGTKPRTALKNARVLRLIDGEPQQIAVNLDAVLRKHEMKRDVPLQPGDLVFVPSSTVPDLSEVLRWLTAYRVVDAIF